MGSIDSPAPAEFDLNRTDADAVCFQKRSDLIREPKVGMKWYWCDLGEVVRDVLFVEQSVIFMANNPTQLNFEEAFWPAGQR